MKPHYPFGKPFLVIGHLALGISFLPLLQTHAEQDFELPPIKYSETAPRDAVAKLMQELEAGKSLDSWNSDRGFVKTLLKKFNVSETTQVLVFSKTSLQHKRINPENPRCIFFNDETYIGWVPGGDAEVIDFEGHLGPVFYQVTPPPHGGVPQFIRGDSCLSCHVSTSTGHVPGLLVRSIFPDTTGQSLSGTSSFYTTIQSPLSERWGGWYVTGKHGTQRHMGNAFAEQDATTRSGAKMDRDTFANLDKLDKMNRFDPKVYPHDQSDIVALMVFEHQIAMHNILTEASMECRLALQRRRNVMAELGGKNDVLAGSTKNILKSFSEKILAQLLFSGEMEQEGDIVGDPAFQQEFLKNRKADHRGDSLRDFDLKTRMFRNRCSYLIYSVSFTSLPTELKDLVWRGLWERLQQPELFAESRNLDIPECKRIRAILKDTVADLPAYWRE